MKIPLALSALAFFSLTARGDNWPTWRGPDGQGHCAEKNLPTTWNATENVRWKAPLPAEGNSTPVVWGDRVFLTQASERGHKRAVMCFARADGRLLWTRETPYPADEPTHETNPYCAASPVTDGERVIAILGSAGAVCYDFSGHLLWKKDLGELRHIWGNASSPVLAGDLAIFWCGPGARQFLLAVDKKTGGKIWQVDVAGGDSGEVGKNWLGSWSTPLVVKTRAGEQLIVPVPNQLKGYEPKTGKELWSCDGLGPLNYTSPLFGDGIAVGMSGYGGPALAVDIGGADMRGDITSKRLWWHHQQRNPQRVGSGVIVGGKIYIVNDPGNAQCFDLKTGEEQWHLPQRVSDKPSWSSAVATGDGLIYIVNHAGDTLVFKAGPRWELVAKNPLGERTLSSVAISNGDIFIRTYKNLWCIGKSAAGK